VKAPYVDTKITGREDSVVTIGISKGSTKKGGSYGLYGTQSRTLG
jgi:hypothetical protein